MSNLYQKISLLILGIMVVFMTPVFGQDSQEEVFFDDPDTSEYYDYYEDDTTYYGDDYYEDDTTYYEDDDSYYEDEYYDDEYADDEYDEGIEYYDDEGYEDELSDEELADLARNMGFTISFAGASPGFVNQALATYNSTFDYRIGVEFPMLMQLFGVRFRFGAEYGTVNFENYMPVGGVFKGSSIVGILSFPAGPGQIKIGVGVIGGNTAIIAENSYGFALGNTLDVRIGIRSNTVNGVLDTKDNNLGTVSWMDGLVILGFNL